MRYRADVMSALLENLIIISEYRKVNRRWQI
nr:MAG TPA: hypothetical protein [Caudoviricetes sp.]